MAFTFDLLDMFHQLTLQGKINMYDFFLAIEHKTDNTGLFKLPPHYKQFAVIIREWQLLQMLKHVGCSHDPTGIEATAPGALAVECPACPRPGYNMLDYDDLMEDDRYAAEMMLAVDAKFRLKLKDRKIKDIELTPGWAYFVEEDKYQKVLRNHLSQPELSSCNSQFSMLTKVNMLKMTGKLSITDLQKGEKYVTMDYIILSTLAVYGVLLWLQLSYDIACQ
ncbi:hypothetical protein EWM64_g8848 [Hericium alpestre]|uniref:CxC2-like cysteine cluster KDZ transposase-associated domain-containing protein n=1 Tax=Hericium alpestre TaxID=135208 RepID=A0A4Y9ZMF9_9AGAM|nr:hypothetical protein EWM64_g8848 [Hericium alpestre]